MSTPPPIRTALIMAITYVSQLSVFGISFFSNDARVIVDSVASPAYEAIQAARGPNDIETYHLMKGRFFSGQIKDKSLERIEFQEVVDSLAKNLAKRNYFPNKDPQKGDLFLVVHYGVTSVDEDWDELMGINSVDDEIAVYGEASGTENSETGTSDFVVQPNYNNLPSNHNRNESNASLLGFDRQLRKHNLTQYDELALRTEMEDERYFIIVMAYDYQALLKDKKLNLQWSTRFSVRSPGTNFLEAHFALSRAAAPYFGTNLENLEWKRTPLHETRVDIGEAEVIEEDVKPRSSNDPEGK